MFNRRYILIGFSLLFLGLAFLVVRMFWNEAHKPVEIPTTSVQSNVPLPEQPIDPTAPKNPKG